MKKIVSMIFLTIMLISSSFSLKVDGVTIARPTRPTCVTTQEIPKSVLDSQYESLCRGLGIIWFNNIIRILGLSDTTPASMISFLHKDMDKTKLKEHYASKVLLDFAIFKHIFYGDYVFDETRKEIISHGGGHTIWARRILRRLLSKSEIDIAKGFGYNLSAEAAEHVAKLTYFNDSVCEPERIVELISSVICQVSFEEMDCNLDRNSTGKIVVDRDGIGKDRWGSKLDHAVLIYRRNGGNISISTFHPISENEANNIYRTYGLRVKI